MIVQMLGEGGAGGLNNRSCIVLCLISVLHWAHFWLSGSGCAQCLTSFSVCIHKKLSPWKPIKENNGFILTLITNKHCYII